ncbi:MAG: GNAT family protein [Acidimicrobiales bacterium]
MGRPTSLKERVRGKWAAVAVGRAPQSCIAPSFWPLFDLRIRTPRLELRYPDDALLMALAQVAAAGTHHPDRMPYAEPWSRAPSGKLERNALQHWWGRRAQLGPSDWTITMAVLEDGRPVGVQDLMAKDFRVRRAFETGSWLGLDYQGRGIGTEMRSAALHLGFEGLGADRAETGAFEDNPESQGVTTKLGYEPNGKFVRVREGEQASVLHYVLTRQRWLQSRRSDITIEGLDACCGLLGLGDE